MEKKEGKVGKKDVGRCNFQRLEMEKVQCRVFLLFPTSLLFFLSSHLFIYSRVNFVSFFFCSGVRLKFSSSFIRY